MTLLRQTYSTSELSQMTGWSYSTIYRKVRKKKLVVLAHEEGEGVRGDGYRFPIEVFHAMYPELRIPFQLELPIRSTDYGRAPTPPAPPKRTSAGRPMHEPMPMGGR